MNKAQQSGDYVMVPREPTEAMLQELFGGYFMTREEAYRAMIAAAPKLYAAPPAAPQQSVEQSGNATIYAWLGFWRDKMPAEAVSQLQDILGPLAAAPAQQGAKQAEPAQTTKEAWWAGYRAGKGLPADTPRQEALAAPPADDEAVRLLREARGQLGDCSLKNRIEAYLAKVGK